MNAAVSFDHVGRFYGALEALHDVTLDVPEGCVYGLLGRNGAGKSTLLRMIPPLLHAHTGTVRVLGRDPWHDDSIRADLGYLADNDSHPPYLRVRDFTELYASLYPRWDDGLAKQLLDRFEIDRKRRVGTLSKGQRRQVGLVLAIAHHPKLLVLDEPGGGLDVVARRSLLEAVLELLANEGATVLFSSHQLADVERIATRVGILHRGRLLADRTLSELKENTCHAAIRTRLTATELAAKLPALRVQSSGDSHRVTLLCAASQAGDFVAQHLGRDTAVEDAQPVNLEALLIDWTGDAA